METSTQTIAREHGAPPRANHDQETNPDAFGAGHDAHHEDLIPKDLRKPSTIAVVLAVLVFVALLGALFVIGYLPHERAEKQAAQDAREIANAATLVQVVHPTPGDATRAIELPCDVKANQDTLIFPRTNGYLKKLYVDTQDHVKAGQLLAEIDTPEVDAQLNQSKANLEQFKAAVVKANADLELAQRTLERYDAAQKSQPGSVTVQQVDEKRAAAEQAQSALASAKANVVAAQADVQRLTVLQGFEKVTAPFDGIITARNFDVGALLSSTENTAGHELFRVTQPDVMRVFVSVPQDDATKIRIGQPAFLTVRNYPARVFKGTVARSSSAIDLATRTLSLELHFPNQDGALYAGMYGMTRIEVADSTKPLLTIPTSTLVFNAEGLRVAVVDPENKIHFQKITAGRDLGTKIEVMNGISNGDQIVDNPGEQLADGESVKLMPQKEEPGPTGGSRVAQR